MLDARKGKRRLDIIDVRQFLLIIYWQICFLGFLIYLMLRVIISTLFVELFPIVSKKSK